MAVIRLGTIERFMGTEAERLAMDVTRVKAGSTFLEDTGFLHVLDGAGNWILKKSASQLTGSKLDQRGPNSNKPLASAVDAGTTYWSVDTDPNAESIEVSDGAIWVVMK